MHSTIIINPWLIITEELWTCVRKEVGDHHIASQRRLLKMNEKGTVWRTVPSKAEDEKGNSKESGDSVPDQGVGVARAEVETKPEGSSQGEELACQKIHLCEGRQK